MVKLLALLCVILCFLACNHRTESPDESKETKATDAVEEAIVYVEWTDFLKFNGQFYYGDWRETTVDATSVGNLLGEVTSAVPSEIVNSSEYVVPENASFLCPVGTKFYAMDGTEDSIAVYVAEEDQYYLYECSRD